MTTGRKSCNELVIPAAETRSRDMAFAQPPPNAQRPLLNSSRICPQSLWLTGFSSSYRNARLPAHGYVTRRRQRSFQPLRCCASGNLPKSQTPNDYPLGPPGSIGRFSPSEWLSGLRGDVKRRLPYYFSDWTDGIRSKSIPVILFLYFACLAPVVAFGGLTSSLTAGSMGVVEFLLSSGITGMFYALAAGQPLTFIAPTGLTLAFTTALFGFCQLAGIPFLPMYAWVGMWTGLILLIAAVANFSDLIKFCTRFTDDIFNSLIATNFLYEATRVLVGAFFIAGVDKTSPFTALTLALGTFFLGRFLTGMRSSRYLWKKARNTLSDFGPVLAIAIMSGIAYLPFVARVGLERLSIPSSFQLAGGRAPLIPLLMLPTTFRIAAIVPALLLTCLFFLDQNISVRVVNSPKHKLRKPPGYHLDMLVLSVCTFVCSVFGLPWMCAGTVQSLAHVQALAKVDSKNGKDTIVSVQENRLTAFCIHAAILGSLFLLPVVERIPMAVISGLFLFLGANMINGNDFLSRTRYFFMDPKLYPEDSPMRARNIPAPQVNAFTGLQLMCLTMLWLLKLNKRTSLFFPSVIATLMLIRTNIAPRLFSSTALETLDGELGNDERERFEKPASHEPLSN